MFYPAFSLIRIFYKIFIKLLLLNKKTTIMCDGKRITELKTELKNRIIRD